MAAQLSSHRVLQKEILLRILRFQLDILANNLVNALNCGTDGTVA
jgi:hypothetical protein